MKKVIYIFTILFLVSSFVLAQEKNAELRPTGGNPGVVFGPQTDETFIDLAESFEGTFPPAGWVKYNPDGGTGWNQQTVGTTPIPGWQGGAVTAVPNGLGGSKMAFCTWNTGGTTSNDQWLVSPQVTNLTSSAYLKFWVRKYSAYNDVLKVKISTTNNQMASFTDLETYTYVGTADTGWVQKTISLAAYAGQSVYIAFQEVVADNYNDGGAIFVDLVELNSGNIPVELVSFTANVIDGKVNLTWTTATETNNSRFEVERSSNGVDFAFVGSVKGNGTTTERNTYNFVDNSVNVGKYTYRLKQVDFDGSYEYSKSIEVNVGLPTEFSLSQNYPNPFNPSTTINFALPKTSNVKLTIYNALGKEVATLVNGVMEAGNHSAVWNAANNASGMYFFKLEAGNFTSTKKMMLIK
jgi:hypothetical protein